MPTFPRMVHFYPHTDEGAEVLSPYFERFWSPILGPTAVVLMRHLARNLDNGTDRGYQIPTVELSRFIGVGEAQLVKTLGRLQEMELVQPYATAGVYKVKTTVTALDDEQLGRLPKSLRVAHRAIERAIANA